MASGDKVLCSPLSARLVDAEGRPAAGVRIVRTWRWSMGGKEGSDEAVTDADGRFSFDAVTGSSWKTAIPHEPAITQKIVAQGSAGEVVLLYANKNNYRMNGELEGRPLDLVCRIDKEPSSDGVLWGTCSEAS